MIRCLAYASTAIFKSRARLVAENLCLRQQLIILKRRRARPQLRDADRRFWILACQLFSGWSRSLIVVKPDTVVGWHRLRLESLLALAITSHFQNRTQEDRKRDP